jgi:hypothetical protein
LLEEPTVARTTWRPRGDQRIALLVRDGRVPSDNETSRDRKEISAVLTEQLKIVFAMFELIEADVCFDSNSRSGVTEVRIIARHNCEPFPLGLPREIGNSV